MNNHNGNQTSIYRRVILKLGGEALSGPNGFGIDPDRADEIAAKVKTIHDLGVQIALVIGAGNIWRGSTGVERGMEQSTADHMGMIGTVMNGLALQDSLERRGVKTRVQTAVQMNAVAEPYIRLRTIRHLEKDRVVIITGGTGNPYFTTDTAAVLRAMEINADIVIKATKVNGIYSADPNEDPSAQRFDHISYQEMLDRKLEVMDMTAITLCQQHSLPILVLDFWQDNALVQAITGHHEVGTVVS